MLGQHVFGAQYAVFHIALDNHALAFAEKVRQQPDIGHRDRVGEIGDAERHLHPPGPVDAALLDEAADMQRRYLAEVGERNEGDLDFLADLESRRGNHDAAIELWKKALILAGTQNEYQSQQYRSKLLDAYRAGGRLQDFVAELARQALESVRVELDPDEAFADIDRENNVWEAASLQEGETGGTSNSNE